MIKMMKPPTISTVSSTSQGRRSQGVFCKCILFLRSTWHQHFAYTPDPVEEKYRASQLQESCHDDWNIFWSGTKPMHFVVSHFQFPDPLCFPMLYHDQGHHDDLAEFLETL